MAGMYKIRGEAFSSKVRRLAERRAREAGRGTEPDYAAAGVELGLSIESARAIAKQIDRQRGPRDAVAE